MKLNASSPRCDFACEVHGKCMFDVEEAAPFFEHRGQTFCKFHAPIRAVRCDDPNSSKRTLTATELATFTSQLLSYADTISSLDPKPDRVVSAVGEREIGEVVRARMQERFPDEPLDALLRSTLARRLMSWTLKMRQVAKVEPCP
jgi:hypothetical protein